MANVFFCKQIFLDQYKECIYRCKSDEGWLEGLEKGDFVFYHLIGSRQGRDFVSKNMPTELNAYEHLRYSVTKLMKFAGWEKDEKNEEFAKFNQVCEFEVPIRKFHALDLFKFNISLLNKSVKQTIGHSLFKLELDNQSKFFELIDSNNFNEYISNELNYRKFIKCDNPNQFDQKSKDVQFCVSNISSKEIIINTTPSFFDIVRDKIDISMLNYPLDKRLTFRNKFIDFVFNNKVDDNKYFDLFTGFWDALCQDAIKRRNKGNSDVATVEPEPDIDDDNGYQYEYSDILINSYNIILRGAPGTGKTWLARNIAADIISNGTKENFSDLSEDELNQIEFVQFHPSYDYTDFVEGIKPEIGSDGSMFFIKKDGIFKTFVKKAKDNFEKSEMTTEEITKDFLAKSKIEIFLSNEKNINKTFETKNGTKYEIKSYNDDYIFISIPGNEKCNALSLNIDNIVRLLTSAQNIEMVRDVKTILEQRIQQHNASYYYSICSEISKISLPESTQAKKVEEKPYIFIIDEINRGEISKILGELFFAIDPGYRGKNGAIATQYQSINNSNTDCSNRDKFYIPENVYIIGTMNDIDRSVDAFDFAMRRRFRFIEIKPEDAECRKMLEELKDQTLINKANKCMDDLNKEIENTDGLNANYKIGPAYFLKLQTLSPTELWTDCLEPLLQDYIQGMPNDLVRTRMNLFKEIFKTSFEITV